MKNNGNLSDEVEQFVLTCHDEQLKTLNVSFTARTFNVDRSHLSRKFRGEKGCFLSTFILNEKMKRAERLLQDSSGITVRELSERIGFFSTRHLSRVFKKYFGIVPSKYRISKYGGRRGIL